MLHVFDTVSRPTTAPTILLPRLYRGVCCCGWVARFEALDVEEARRDWAAHFKVGAR